VVGFLEAAGILTVLLLGAARIQAGGLNSQGFSSYVAALLMLIDPISHLTTNFNEFQQGQASLRRLRAIEAEPVEAPDRPSAQPLGSVRGELVLEQVRFGYNPAQPVLHDLDLQVRPGQVVALVGPSGAGKSTLFSLLLRFNTAQQGRVLLDGHDLADLRARELRRAVALVPQQSSVFSGTVAEAIAFGRPASEAAIRQAASLANAAGFIEALPQGYASRIEERGSNFSGGSLHRLLRFGIEGAGGFIQQRPRCRSGGGGAARPGAGDGGPHRAGDCPPASHRAGCRQNPGTRWRSHRRTGQSQ